MPGKVCFPDMTCKVIDAGRLQLLDLIGRGGYGAVYRARSLSTNTPRLYAVKVQPKSPAGSTKAVYLSREIEHHMTLSSHPNVITIHRVVQDATYVYLVMDYCPGGDMWRAIVGRQVFARNDFLVRSVFLQLIDTVAACHELGIYHRDLKPNNILISHDCNHVFITDFGLSTKTDKNMTFNAGTAQYKSPECANPQRDLDYYSTARSDIWALGVILLNMLTGRKPWGSPTVEDEFYKQFHNNPDYLREVFPISQEAEDILRIVLCLDEQDVISLSSLRRIVENTRTFFMTEEEVANAGACVKHIARSYLRPRRQVEQYREPEKDESNSLEDDSDDSDEHSIGIRSRSLLAVEEGRIPVFHTPLGVSRNVGPHLAVPVVCVDPKHPDPSLPAPSVPKSSKSISSQNTGPSPYRTPLTSSANSEMRGWMRGTAEGILQSGLSLRQSVRRMVSNVKGF
ncbi:hypothetical protein PHLCEN_2v12700 [Hermanssonia centrifuga]|uniref:Protein kinase domain-containing protein n=1 Tax=Hermanssonia centrifuga TaxID=98765 RepID=A0A2R6NGI2_9APHY|nr:hypothetical protein PHLCEN_2v12700 [Hermanssonia centrifuga]